MAEWRVQLQGSSLYLQELKAILSDHDPTITQEDNNFYLKLSAWEQLQEAEQIRNQAIHLIQLLDSTAHVFFRNTAPITIGHLVRINDDGQRQYFVFAEGSLTLEGILLNATATVAESDGQRIEHKQEHPIIRLLRASANDVLVADALRFFRRGDWISLYKAYEIVRDDLHGEQGIIHQGWLTKRSLSRFTQTAQSRDILGDDARHASRKYKPPSDPISLQEAKTMISELVQSWIDSKQ